MQRARLVQYSAREPVLHARTGRAVFLTRRGTAAPRPETDNPRAPRGARLLRTSTTHNPALGPYKVSGALTGTEGPHDATNF